MNYRFLYWGLSLLCISFCACDKDDNNDSNNFATGIVELPALRNGANDVFVTHYTTFNGQKVTSFSMEYDKSKKHSRWVAFRFDNQTRLQGATRGDNFIPDPSLDTEYQRTQVDFGKKGYDRGHLCASADRHTDSKPSKTIKLVDYALSIDELEEKTGIDFFPNLNDNLENALESTYSTKAWPGLE